MGESIAFCEKIWTSEISLPWFQNYIKSSIAFVRDENITPVPTTLLSSGKILAHVNCFSSHTDRRSVTFDSIFIVRRNLVRKLSKCYFA